jgi:hypothetical protein
MVAGTNKKSLFVAFPKKKIFNSFINQKPI